MIIQMGTASPFREKSQQEWELLSRTEGTQDFWEIGRKRGNRP